MGFPWGLDLGNQNCVIAIARKGGIDVIDNEASSRKVRLFDLACTRAHAREWGLPPPGPYPEHDARVRTFFTAEGDIHLSPAISPTRVGRRSTSPEPSISSDRTHRERSIRVLDAHWLEKHSSANLQIPNGRSRG